MNFPKTRKEFLTQDIKSAVNAYLMARTFAETMRDQVNAIYKDILTECPIYADRTGKQILDPDHLYQCKNDALVTDAYEEADLRERKTGIKPDFMEFDFCPALVAKHLQTKAEWLLIEAAGDKYDITNDKLLCAGLEKRQEFIDLIVGMVVSDPNFKNSLTEVVC